MVIPPKNVYFWKACENCLKSLVKLFKNVTRRRKRSKVLNNFWSFRTFWVQFWIGSRAFVLLGIRWKSRYFFVKDVTPRWASNHRLSDMQNPMYILDFKNSEIFVDILVCRHHRNFWDFGVHFSTHFGTWPLTLIQKHLPLIMKMNKHVHNEKLYPSSYKAQSEHSKYIFIFKIGSL